VKKWKNPGRGEPGPRKQHQATWPPQDGKGKPKREKSTVVFQEGRGATRMIRRNSYAQKNANKVKQGTRKGGLASRAGASQKKRAEKRSEDQVFGLVQVKRKNVPNANPGDHPRKKSKKTRTGGEKKEKEIRKTSSGLQSQTQEKGQGNEDDQKGAAHQLTQCNQGTTKSLRNGKGRGETKGRQKRNIGGCSLGGTLRENEKKQLETTGLDGSRNVIFSKNLEDRKERVRN